LRINPHKVVQEPEIHVNVSFADAPAVHPVLAALVQEDQGERRAGDDQQAQHGEGPTAVLSHYVRRFQVDFSTTVEDLIAAIAQFLHDNKGVRAQSPASQRLTPACVLTSRVCRLYRRGPSCHRLKATDSSCCAQMRWRRSRPRISSRRHSSFRLAFRSRYPLLLVLIIGLVSHSTCTRGTLLTDHRPSGLASVPTA
jgi:hypothetical protein